MLTPSETIRDGSSASTSLGAAIATDGPRSSAPASAATAPGSGTVPWLSSQIDRSAGIFSSASATAAAKLVLSGDLMMFVAPPVRAISSRSSIFPQATMVTASSVRDWARVASSARRS